MSGKFKAAGLSILEPWMGNPVLREGFSQACCDNLVAAGRKTQESRGAGGNPSAESRGFSPSLACWGFSGMPMAVG